MLLGVGGDGGGEGGGVDAQLVARRQQHVVEPEPVGGLHDVAAVRPRAGERRVGDAEELVVVVAQGATRTHGRSRSVTGMAVTSFGGLDDARRRRPGRASTSSAASEAAMRSGRCVPMIATGRDGWARTNASATVAAVDALALGEPVEHGEQLGPHAVAGGQPAAGERAPHQRRRRRRACRRRTCRRAAGRGATAEYSGWLRDERERQVGLQRVDLGRRVVGDADLADLALVAQRGERRGHVGRVGEQVRPVDLVEVDDVDAEPAQRRLARRPQRTPGWSRTASAGAMPPLVASTIRSRSAGAAASTRPSSSSHLPKPVPPQSRPYTSAVSTRFIPASSAASTQRLRRRPTSSVGEAPLPVGERPDAPSAPSRRGAVSDERVTWPTVSP